jgi:hypothetical protein
VTYFRSFLVLISFGVAVFASFVFVSLLISSFSLRSEKTDIFRFEAKKNLLIFRIVSLQPKTNGAPYVKVFN